VISVKYDIKYSTHLIILLYIWH